VLRDGFFDSAGKPAPFDLRDKRNTQDDPLDEYIHQLLRDQLTDVTCTKATGPLITPDMVLMYPGRCSNAPKSQLRDDLSRIIGIEVKKVERTEGGAVARASGVDYNTTPPCGVVRVYDSASEPIDIRCFYLFVCMEGTKANGYKVTALCLCDGNVLNRDFDLYLQITGQRQKRIGLGTYGDGADRQRPFLIFANPLGVPELEKQPVLIHPSSSLERDGAGLKLVYELVRTGGEHRYEFCCYRDPRDVPKTHVVAKLEDPFLVPERTLETQARGRFVLPIRHTEPSGQGAGGSSPPSVDTGEPAKKRKRGGKP
jgi:hypothetical protein